MSLEKATWIFPALTFILKHLYSDILIWSRNHLSKLWRQYQRKDEQPYSPFFLMKLLVQEKTQKFLVTQP